MKFCWSTLRVNDMEESLRFYEEVVGLEMNQRFPAGPGVEIAFLGNGETKIELIHESGAPKSDLGIDISWGFEVESLESIMERLAKHEIVITAGPFEPNPTTRFLFVEDPNGMKIQFVEKDHTAL